MDSIIVPKRSLVLPRGSRGGLELPQRQRGFMVVNPSRFGGASGDPYWANVDILLQFDDPAANSPFFLDSARPGATGSQIFSSSGSTGVYTAADATAFGGRSLSVPGTGIIAVNASQSSPWMDFGSGDFTIECMCTPAGTGTRAIISKWPSGSGATAESFLFYIDTVGGANQLHFSWGIGSLNTGIGSTTTFANTRVYLCVQRKGTVVEQRIGFPGGNAPVDATTGSMVGTMNNFTGQVSVVTYGNNTAPFNGAVDFIRVTRGVARYTGTIAVPTAAFPNHA
jgi:hypothetical protein